MAAGSKSQAALARGVRACLLAVALGGLLVQASCNGTTAAGEAPPGGLAPERLEIRSASGSTLRAWLGRGVRGAGAVLLLHGVGASHVDMLDRARFLRAAGYSVLLLDFRGCGESGGARSTYGGLESLDARAAVDLLRERLPGERIGVIGVSMGGAATLLGQGPLPVQALVLESVYPTIEDAVRDRLGAWLGLVGRALAPVALRLLLPRDGVTAADLRPADRVADQTAPTFVLAGTEDPYTPLEESQALFRRARAPKQFWAIPGAAHEDLHAFAGAEYERRVSAFLGRYLRGEGRSRAAGRVARREPAP